MILAAPRTLRNPSPRRGFVLLAVLVFVLLISMVTVSLLFRNRAEETASAASGSGEQAWAAAFSGIQEALRLASMARSGSPDWRDNPGSLKEKLVFEDGSDRWFFTVFSPGDSETPGEVRYGLTDEASRIHLNHPGGCDLSKIPRLTPELLQSLRQALGQPGGDPLVRPADLLPMDPSLDLSVAASGSLQGVTASLRRPPGQLTSLEDLLQVPGFSAELLFGEDVNRNGRLDPNEDDGDENPPADNRDGRLDHGMAQYLTTAAYDPDLTSAGKPRLDLNQPAVWPSSIEFPPAFTNYLAALRRANLRLNHPVDVLEAVVQVKDEQGQDVQVSSGITKEELPRLLDQFTADKPGVTKGRREGLVNLNTASAVVLATLPGLDLSLAESIVAARPGLRPDQRSNTAWLPTEGLLDTPRFKAVAPHLTTQSYQFQFSVIGYALPSGQYRVFQVEVDAGGAVPTVTGLRDITRLGIPFNLSVETLEQPTQKGASFRSPGMSSFHHNHG